jgi:eukaryotic-like serine/threonine-protein kinase
MPGIFISYRRTDNPDAVGRIYDRLASEFGKARVFKDVDSIPLGQDFRGHLNEVVGDCAAVLAIIGPKWTDIRNEDGKRRLEDTDDFVRIELEAALSRKIPVVPVLVGHAAMPPTSQLPPSLSSLAFRQSIEVRPDPDFHNDATRLVSALRAIVDPNAPREEHSLHPATVHVATAPVATSPSRKFAWMSGLAVAAILAAIAFAIPALKHLREVPAPEMRTDIQTPDTEQPRSFSLSPDGRQIVFVANNGGVARLWLRPFAATTAQLLPGTEGAGHPFWSPDSRSIAFPAGGSLKRLDLGGGQPLTLAPVHDGSGGGSWNADGVVLFKQSTPEPLMRVAATGGAAPEVIKLPPEVGAATGPVFLADGVRFLFATVNATSQGIYIGGLDGRAPIKLTTDSARFTWLPSGWLLWLRAGALVAQRLDIEKSRLTGEPVTVANDVNAVSVSRTGLVAYRSGAIVRQRQLTWFDRSGSVKGAIGEPDVTLDGPQISHDGRRVAISRGAARSQDIWVLDGTRSVRMTFEKSDDSAAVWSPDGARIAFYSADSGAFNLYQKFTNGAGGEELLAKAGLPKVPTSWSADGRYLLYFNVDPKTNPDLWVLPMTGDRKPFVFLQTSFDEDFGEFSPNGKWVAYQSNESGRNEIYVRPFNPDSTAVAGHWPISTAGGIHPRWRPDGKEIYYLSPTGEMMAASIDVTRSGLVPGTPTRLFQTRVPGGGVQLQQLRQYDVAPDGRFLINTELETGAIPPITLIQNWNPDAGK